MANNPVIQKREVVFEAPSTHTVEDKEFVATFKAADETPSVLGSKKFKAGNTVANNITYFDDGYDGKDIWILGDGFTTVKHDVTKIVTNTGIDKLLAVRKVYHYTRYRIGTDDVWVADTIV